MSTATTQVFAQMEQESYHACREWHVWLILRLRQLQARNQTTPVGDRP